MSKKKTVLLGFGIGVLVLALVGVPVPRIRHVSGQAGELVANGDVNGDGTINITDAIYLLRYMFQDGPQPVACAAGAPDPVWPPRIGQIVNLQSEAPASLKAGVGEGIYDVPDGKWLVVTDMAITLHANGSKGVEVDERVDRQERTKLG